MSQILFARTTRLGSTPDLPSLIGDGVGWLSQGTSLVGRGNLLTLDSGSGTGRFARVSGTAQDLFSQAHVEDDVDLPGSGPVLFGSFTFDERDPNSECIIPNQIFGVGDGVAWQTDLSLTAMPPAHGSAEGEDVRPLRPWPLVAPKTEPGPTPGEGSLAGHLPPEDAEAFEQWLVAFGLAHREVSTGRLDKVVLARKIELDLPFGWDREQVLRFLLDRHPLCFIFSFSGFLGASPELLIRKLGVVVDSLPLAGSAPRGGDSSDDLRLGQALKASDKNRAEHQLTVKSVVEPLRPFCSELISEPEPSLLLLADVQHLATKVQGRLDRDCNSLALAGALHPTAAVCGVPQQGAIEFIRKVEGFERGRYAGPVGWMDARGDGEWALGLRSAKVGNTRATLFAGAGILSDSDPLEEFRETSMKLQAIHSALNHLAGNE